MTPLPLKPLLLTVMLALPAGWAVGDAPSAKLPPSLYEQLAARGHRVITLEDLEATLPPAPVRVGFDVDDTVLFSQPGFFYAKTNRDGPSGENRYGERPLDNEVFWTDQLEEHDKFSMPKKIALKLLQLHKERGDEIHFVTARLCPENDPSPLTQRLNDLFSLTNEHPVVFSNRRSKTAHLERLGLAMFYGDSDGDIKAAREAGIRPIRIIRTPISDYTRHTDYGSFDEEILFNSEF